MTVKWAIQAAGVLGKLGVLLLLIYLSICVYLYVNQRAMIFYQVAPTASADPASVLMLEHAGQRLKVWQIRPPLAGAPASTAANLPATPSTSSTPPAAELPAIIYFGGNAENVAQSIPAFAANFPL
ncbi:MAG: hypothetical protein RL748_3147, partial [Pseudomonadota bacterium]